MHVRFHILPASAAPSASLFALRHNAGHLLRDGDGKVILCPDVETAERERRRNSASAPVSYVVALVPESDVREVDAMERLAEALAKRLVPPVSDPRAETGTPPDVAGPLMAALARRGFTTDRGAWMRLCPLDVLFTPQGASLYVEGVQENPFTVGYADPERAADEIVAEARSRVEGLEYSLRIVRATLGMDTTPTGGDVQSDAEPASVEALEASLATQAAASAHLAQKMRADRLAAAVAGLIDEAGHPIPESGDAQPLAATALRLVTQGTTDTLKIGAEERPIVENTAGQWSDTPGAAEIPPVALTVDPRVQEALSAKAPRKGRRQ